MCRESDRLGWRGRVSFGVLAGGGIIAGMGGCVEPTYFGYDHPIGWEGGAEAVDEPHKGVMRCHGVWATEGIVAGVGCCMCVCVCECVCACVRARARARACASASAASCVRVRLSVRVCVCMCASRGDVRPRLDCALFLRADTYIMCDAV